MLKSLALALICTLSMSSAFADGHIKDHAAKSKLIMKEFMGQLKGELQKAMKAGGPINAIGVCNKTAPEIAHTLSTKYNWQIARTSLKFRNPENAPDAWETKVLKDFEARKQQGEKVKPMAYFAVHGDEGKQQFRFMKAIPTGEVCLKCHGQKLAPEVKAKLDELYPADKATGFKLGDIRGAFTFSRKM